MTRSIGWIKNLIMLVLLMLIATRLTWLQTSGLPIEITAGFYRTGLYFNENSRHICAAAPEATFPLAATMVVAPPAPSTGMLAPGLEIVMALKCQLSRLEVEDFPRWNPWLFMGSSFFASLTVRLITSSWTAGLLAGVAILSRGTLQSRAGLASGEPFAMLILGASWCALALFGRTLWLPWLAATLGLYGASCFFLPPLVATLLPALGATLVFVVLSSRSPSSPSLKTMPFSPLTRPEHYWTYRSPPIYCYIFAGLSVGLIWSVVVRMNQIWPGAMDFSAPLKQYWNTHSWHDTVARAVITGQNEFLNLWPDVDLHLIISVLLIFCMPFTRGRLGPAGRITTLTLISLGITQILFDVVLDGFISTTREWTTTANMDTLSAAVARVFEPLAIAWGAAALWRILDAISGYRLSTSGWSIRGRAKIGN